jgi:hypothetical protein
VKPYSVAIIKFWVKLFVKMYVNRLFVPKN